MNKSNNSPSARIQKQKAQFRRDNEIKQLTSLGLDQHAAIGLQRSRKWGKRISEICRMAKDNGYTPLVAVRVLQAHEQLVSRAK